MTAALHWVYYIELTQTSTSDSTDQETLQFPEINHQMNNHSAFGHTFTLCSK